MSRFIEVERRDMKAEELLNVDKIISVVGKDIMTAGITNRVGITSYVIPTNMGYEQLKQLIIGKME